MRLDPSLQAPHIDRQCGHEQPVNNTKETFNIQNQKLTAAGASQLSIVCIEKVISGLQY